MTTNTDKTTLLDELLRQHAAIHEHGMHDKEACKRFVADIDAELLHLCPQLTAKEIDTLAWLSKGGGKMLSDLYKNCVQLFFVCGFHPAADVAEQLLKVFIKAHSDADYAQEKLKAAGVENYTILNWLNLEGDNDWARFLSIHSLEECSLRPGGSQSEQVDTAHKAIEEIIANGNIVHDDGAYTAFTLIALDAYHKELLQACETISRSVQWVQDEKWAQIGLDFVDASYAAGKEGNALTVKYPEDHFYQIEDDEVGKKAQMFGREALEHVARTGDFKSYDQTAFIAFVVEQQSKESPVVRMLREAGMPEELISIFA